MKRRCAIYARYSSDLQRESSIEDQIRRCREYAARQGWSIVEEFVVADRAVSAASVAGRDGLKRLEQVAKRKDRPFDCLLVDDSSRLAREISDALHTVKVFKFYGVAVVSVTQGIDSSHESARPLLALNGIIDEQYIVDLAKKVYRGQEGRAISGYTTGGRVYGYDNVPIEDPTRIGKYGRPAVLGVRLEVNAEQAVVLNRIFSMYAEGNGLRGIAVQLNAEGVPGPHGPWSRYTIHEMLRNERYRGVNVWGRTQKARNPETGRKVSRATSASQWRRVEVPEWRIIPEDLWLAVEARREESGANFHKNGGMGHNRSGHAYLFSGNLVCGDCGGSMVVCAGGGKRGYVKYGCHQHKHNGTCDNKLMIRQDRLEEQLLDALQQRILNPKIPDAAITRCEEEVRTRLAEMARQGAVVSLESLTKDLEEKKRRRAKLIDAIETAGDITSLTDRLRDLEGEIKRIQHAIENHRPQKLDDALSGLREHVTRELLGFKEVLLAAGNDAEMVRAKAALTKHVGKLVLTPALRDGRPVYKVTGNVTVAGESEKCRKQLVARDGIEPPTPAFSGLDSTIVM
jgi:site-specific DNA recombinase